MGAFQIVAWAKARAERAPLLPAFKGGAIEQKSEWALAQ